MTDSRLNRRAFVRASIASVIAGTFSRHARSQVDPLTYLQAAAAAVTIISGILGMSDNDVEEKIDAANAKLDLIIANQTAIINEIRALRVYVDDALYQSWVNEYSRDIRASRDMYRAYSVRPINSEARTALNTISLDCFRTTLKIGNAGYVVFPTFALGVGIVFSIFRLLRVPRTRIAATKKEFLPTMEYWLDKSSPASLVSTIDRFISESTARRAALEARSKSFDTNERWVRQGTSRSWCYYRHVTRVSVVGNFDVGYSVGSATEVKTGESRDCDFYDRPCLKCPAPLSESELGNVVERSMSALRKQVDRITGSERGFATAFSIVENKVVIPSFVPSGHAYIDDMNRERIAVYEVLLRISQLEVLREEMEKFLRLLRA